MHCRCRPTIESRAVGRFLAPTEREENGRQAASAGGHHVARYRELEERAPPKPPLRGLKSERPELARSSGFETVLRSLEQRPKARAARCAANRVTSLYAPRGLPDTLRGISGLRAWALKGAVCDARAISGRWNARPFMP